MWQGEDVGGRLDFVASWFVLAARYIAQSGARASLVSTNSITQGVQPATLWNELNKSDVDIDFAHQTFKWQNEASGMAAVHVVIIGFSRRNQAKGLRSLWVYEEIRGNPTLRKVPCINAYLLDAPEILIETRSMPLQESTPRMVYGSKPTDGGFMTDITPEAAEEIRSLDPIAAKYLRRIVGARELIQGIERWCLWLAHLDPSDVRASKVVMTRLEQVKEMRLASKKKATRELAISPHLFEFNSQPKSEYIAVPLVSSESRQYVPMAYFGPEVVTNNSVSLIADAPLWLFGFLQSRPFNVWNKAVSGRMKSDTRISNTLTYNNFPFPDLDDELHLKLSESAQEVLTARLLYPKSSLADLYSPTSMPAELAKAHTKLDLRVLATYGLKATATDAEILEVLFAMYAEQAKASMS